MFGHKVAKRLSHSCTILKHFFKKILDQGEL